MCLLFEWKAVLLVSVLIPAVVVLTSFSFYKMKAVLLLFLLLLAAVVQDSEAKWISRKVRDKWIAFARPIFDKINKTVRGKRSTLPMNRLEEVNAIDLAATFNLDLFAVLGLFDDCDVNEDGALDGQEVQVFLGKIEGLVNANDQEPAVTP